MTRDVELPNPLVNIVGTPMSPFLVTLVTWRVQDLELTIMCVCVWVLVCGDTCT